VKIFLKINGLLLLIISLPIFSNAQVYPDHFGTGNYIGVKVSSSDSNGNNEAINSITGTDLIPDLPGASRFLAHSTLGYNYEDIEEVAQLGIENWMEEQFNISGSSFRTKVEEIYQDVISLGVINNDDEKDEYLSFAFYDFVFKQPDLLRQKTAFALSQILVIAPATSSIGNYAIGNADYYDLLYQDAFGNFRDILYNITRHVSMGYYLSTARNAKADFNLGTYPDENYAREIMQLFTIGLYELNNDGSHKLDNEGNSIPTYDIADIEQLSKVFTGFGAAEKADSTTAYFTTGKGNTNFLAPMAMYENFHDKSEKIMIDGTVLPANQPGLEDVEVAIDILFNHPNVGPFIGLRLIQQCVKSNPSPAYINRVATIFNNDGYGERGNLKAVIKAVLLDPEARECAIIDDEYSTGKLLQPMERVTKLYRAFNLSTPSNKFYFRDEIELSEDLGQSFLAAPSVFNFFSPFYAESEYVAPNNLVSPEFQVQSTTTAINYLNWVEDALKIRPFKNYTKVNSTGKGLANNNDDKPILNLNEEINELATNGIDALLNRLDILLCAGQLSSGSKSTIKNTINQYFENVSNYSNEKAVEDAIYFIMASPNFTILK